MKQRPQVSCGLGIASKHGALSFVGLCNQLATWTV
jgi:hypothetical protein